MKTAGIVCEYNPFHNGHSYHISRTRENGATHIVAVMSGNFVQRGDAAIVSKFERAKAAVLNGADLVIEIPVSYVLSSAEGYAGAAVYIMNSLGCIDEISFGSECGDTGLLIKAAEASAECSSSPELKLMLEKGASYPAAISQLVLQKYGNTVSGVLDSPNNTLAVEYIKALSALNSDIRPFTVKRKNAEHDGTEVKDNFASASFIRQNIDNPDCSSLMPESVYTMLMNAAAEGKYGYTANLEKAVLYKMRSMTPEQLRNIPDVSQGLEYRIYEAGSAASVKEMEEKIKTRRYTMARLRRIMLCALLGITREDVSVPPSYARVLAFNERGTEILRAAKKNASIPVDTSLSRLSKINSLTGRCAELEAFSTDIHSLSFDNPAPAGEDFRAKICLTR